MIKNKDFLVLLIRLFLGYIFFSAGICKLTHGQFGQLIGPPWLEEALTKYGLGLFAQVVACCQVMCGALLFTQRFSTLGAVMLVPMNVSILAVTVSQKWAGTPYVNVVFLLLNLLLLFYEYKRFLFLFSSSAQPMTTLSPLEAFRSGRLPWLVLTLALLTMAAAPFNNVFTNTFGILTFLATGACVLLPTLLHKLQKIVIAQAIGNMLLVTLWFKLPNGPLMLAASCGILLLLLLLSLWLNSRKMTHKLMEPSMVAQ